MTNELSWHTQGKTLILRGELNRNTLLMLWLQRHKLLDGIQFLDVSGLKYVDSAGVALILHFYYYQQQCGSMLELTGITDQLRALITLYRLQTIIPFTSSDSI